MQRVAAAMVHNSIIFKVLMLTGRSCFICIDMPDVQDPKADMIGAVDCLRSVCARLRALLSRVELDRWTACARIVQGWLKYVM
eukprot:1277940-Amphidinium_carterae.1